MAETDSNSNKITLNYISFDDKTSFNIWCAKYRVRQGVAFGALIALARRHQKELDEEIIKISSSSNAGKAREHK